MSKTRSSHSGFWDRVGIVISGLCIAHCVLLPILFTLPIIGSAFVPSEDLTHFILFGIILLSAMLAFVPGYRIHKQKKPLIWLFTGLAFVLFATFLVHDLLGHHWELVFAVIGSLSLIRAHFLNHTECNNCGHH